MDEQTTPTGPVDPPSARPGVPMETEPRPAPGAHWNVPARQPGAEHALHRMEIDRATPVFGTAQPPRGLSGAMRRKAYAIPEHMPAHWLLLLAADRVDVLENRLADTMSGPLERAGVADGSERLRTNALPVAVGVLAGAWVASRLLRGVLEPRS